MSTIAESDVREDFVGALVDPDYLAMERSSAGLEADELLDIAEGELGVLFRQGPKELGFVHRMLQEQLAAEHATNRLTPREVQALFEQHVGDPQWREVLLGIMWRLKRPTELRQLVQVLEAHIDETPEGLLARETLAEATFGPYHLPGGDTRQYATELLDTVESHPYDRHRSRLLTSVLSGLQTVPTRGMVIDRLSRWAVHARRPWRSLNWQLAQLDSDGSLEQSIRDLLLAALRYDDESVAYSGAQAIAMRCSEDGKASADELSSNLVDGA